MAYEWTGDPDPMDIDPPKPPDGITSPDPISNINAPLLRLPAELRDQLYGLTIIDPLPIDVISEWRQPALSLTCTAIRCETLVMFYARNKFVFDFDKGDQGSKTAQRWLLAIGRINASNLHKLQLENCDLRLRANYLRRLSYVADIVEIMVAVGGCRDAIRFGNLAASEISGNMSPWYESAADIPPCRLCLGDGFEGEARSESHVQADCRDIRWFLGLPGDAAGTMKKVLSLTSVVELAEPLSEVTALQEAVGVQTGHYFVLMLKDGLNLSISTACRELVTANWSVVDAIEACQSVAQRPYHDQAPAAQNYPCSLQYNTAKTLVKAFAQGTGMTCDFALLCLQEANWDLKTACKLFDGAKARIPAAAFALEDVHAFVL